MSAIEELEEILAKLNQAGADKFAYSAKITTNAKGEGQIHCSVKSNESVSHCEEILRDLTKKTLDVMVQNNINLPKVKV